MKREDAKLAIENLVERFSEHRKEYHHADYNEQKVRQDFINPFFKALGWDVDNERGDSEAYREVIYEDKVVVRGKVKAPDYGFRLAGSGKKRLFYVEAKKPSVPIKTHKESAYQLRRYGSSAQAYVSILTNFEDFVVYDCSRVPNQNDSASVARLKHIHFEDYVKEFDFIYDTFSHEAVTRGRFDKFIQAGASKRGTDTLDKRFVQSLDKWRKYLAVSIAYNNRKLDDEEVNFSVQQTIDRLIFLRFCEDRAVEPYGQLKSTVAKGESYKNLFDLFKQADDKYNSGLFDFKKDVLTPTLKVENKVIKNIVEELYYPKCNYEFSVMPVEILGNAYEQFLGKVIRVTPARSVKIEEKPEVRKAGGVFYTPQYIVDYIVQHTVGKLIEGKSPKEIEKIKIVDPACGSGSFLLGAFDYLLNYHINWYHQKGYATKKGKDNPFTPQGTLTTHEKKRILLNSIYGVDIDANAVEVTKLSLLLKCMEGETEASIKQQMTMFHERVLPDLDNNIKDGNSLIDVDFYEKELDLGFEKKIKPFSWRKGFPDIFKNGGFDVTIGNPPYLGGRDWKEDNGNAYDYFIERYSVAEYQFDMYSLFWERAIKITRDNGFIGYITPNTWLNNQSNKKLRTFILDNSFISSIVDYSKIKVFEQATVLPIVTILQKSSTSKMKTEIFEPKNGELVLKNHIKQTTWKDGDLNIINIDLNEQDLALRNKIESNTTPLETLAQIKFGIKVYETGKGTPPQKASFAKDKVFESDKKNDKTYRPYLEGKDIQPYSIEYKNRYLKYGANLAAPRDPNLFVGDRILVRRIVGKTLICAYTNEDYVTSQLLQIVKPFDPSITQILLGILNSKLLAYYFRKKYNRQDKTFPEIRIYELASLPIKYSKKEYQKNKKIYSEISKHAEQLTILRKSLDVVKVPSKVDQIKVKAEFHEESLNKKVFELYEISDKEIGIIEKEANG
ncbi:MAG TPA: TaqI-like C-terminal specificity domain-containing protein [Flavobacteriales bacterium]|nr:TaqI-like C-terminal specificity domain-containing protein [Flavobacteriales bacterium]